MASKQGVILWCQRSRSGRQQADEEQHGAIRSGQQTSGGESAKGAGGHREQPAKGGARRDAGGDGAGVRRELLSVRPGAQCSISF
ncbi:hypothetical protein ACIQB5_34780 [Streptomyces sp. NPDC088560]|uniref:hypothetical protein n=1 Tax=Streptomyces sp. NPDC088560 TaxID=3365868 RepID=UPI0038033638